MDEKGNPIMATTYRTEVVRDEAGNPMIAKPGIFVEYGIQLVNFSLKDIDFDDTIDGLIAQKKEAEQQQAVARANAEKARQDAITAEEQGNARIAQAKADEEVEKIRAVTAAQKEKEVAELDAERELSVARLQRQAAEEQAARELALKQAEARANEMLVRAGLTPRERAEIERDTAIGIAAELAKIQFPKIMSFGGSSEANDPITAIGLNQMLQVIEQLENQN